MGGIDAWALTGSFVWPVVAGFAIGAMFFGGLLWTTRRALASALAPLWFLGSLLLRTGIALAAFYAIGRDDWRRWLACLIGFTLARVVIMYATRRRQLSTEVRHAAEF